MSEPLECLEVGNDCEGAVEYRMALSATGRSFPRCNHHWDIALDKHEANSRRYPDSPCPPSWFDASYAGECWDEC